MTFKRKSPLDNFFFFFFYIFKIFLILYVCSFVCGSSVLWRLKWSTPSDHTPNQSNECQSHPYHDPASHLESIKHAPLTDEKTHTQTHYYYQPADGQAKLLTNMIMHVIAAVSPPLSVPLLKGLASATPSRYGFRPEHECTHNDARQGTVQFY